MKTLLVFVVLGLATGSVYGLAAMGLVLTYKTSGVFNFGHGAVAALGAYAFYELNSNSLTLPWPVALVAAVLIAGLLVGLAIAYMGRSISNVPVPMQVVAMVGLLLLVQGAATLHYGGAARFTAPFLPTRSIDLAGVNVGVDQIIVIGVGVVSCAAMYAFFRFARLGMAMRAVVDNPELVSQTGTPPLRVQAAAWVIGCSFAALSGILLAPTLGLQAALLTLLVVQAFGAAAIGRFSSLPMTFVGGLVIGVAAAIIKRYTTEYPALQGLPTSLPFIVLFVVLVLTRQVPEGGSRGGWAATAGVRDPRLRAGGLVAIGAAALAAPFLVGTRLPSYTNALVFAIVFLSLSFLVRCSGQTSLCHAAFAALGASTLPQVVDAGLPWLAALVVTGIVAAAAGTVVAVPAIRLSPLYLALLTFGFGLLMQNLLYGSRLMFGKGLVDAPAPSIIGVDFAEGKRLYYLVLAILALSTALVVAVQRSRLGRLLQGMADAPVALASGGVSVGFLRIAAFALSAFLAGVAGALYGALARSVNGSSFDPFLSLTLLAVLAIAGKGTVRSAVIASIAFAVVPSYFTSTRVADYLVVVFGAGALLVGLGRGSFSGTRLRAVLPVAAARARRRPRLPRQRAGVLASRGAAS